MNDSGNVPASMDDLHQRLDKLVANGPVLVAVDDCQWLERESLEWLCALSTRGGLHRPLAVMLTVSVGEPSRDPELIEELRTLAVLGGTGDLHLINQLTGLTPVVVADTVRALTETGLVTVEGSTVRLAHELCRLQLSRGITHTALLATNAQAAQAMARDDAPAAQVARYLLASPVVAEDWAAVSLKQAADDAVRDGNLTAAANYLTRLNAEPLPAALRADALLSLAEIEARTSGQPANDHIAAALAMPLDDANRRRALAALADVRYLTGADDQAPSVDGPDALVAELYLQHAVTAGEGVRLLERAGEHVGTISGQAARQLSSLAQCAAQSGQGPERAKTWGERALASAGTGLEDTVARLRAIEVLVETEEVDTARQAAENVVDLARTGGPRLYAAALAVRLVLRHRLGKLPAAIADARSALDASALTQRVHVRHVALLGPLGPRPMRVAVPSGAGPGGCG